jgi:predicted ribosomally synthesized peptide with SipW-like signal peptide
MYMKTKTTRRALVLSVLSLFVCVAMLVGTTFAWFTDSVTSGRNKIQSGNLDVVLEYWNGTEYAEVDKDTKLFDDAALWEPGHTEVAYLKVSNAGSLALRYQLAVNVYDEVLGKTKEDADIKLSDYLVFSVVDKQIESNADLYTRESAIAAAGDTMGLSAYVSDVTPLEEKGDADYVALIIYMPTSIGN